MDKGIRIVGSRCLPDVFKYLVDSIKLNRVLAII